MTIFNVFVHLLIFFSSSERIYDSFCQLVHND